MGVNTTIFGSFRLPLAFGGPPSGHMKDAIKENLCLARVTAPGHRYMVPFVVLPVLSADTHLTAIHHALNQWMWGAAPRYGVYVYMTVPQNRQVMELLLLARVVQSQLALLANTMHAFKCCSHNTTWIHALHATRTCNSCDGNHVCLRERRHASEDTDATAWWCRTPTSQRQSSSSDSVGLH